jgi:hypothetical protein
MTTLVIDEHVGTASQISNQSPQRILRSNPAGIASQRLKTLQTTLLQAVLEQPLRALGPPPELGPPIRRHAALASQGGQQVLESHADVKPIENSFGG